MPDARFNIFAPLLKASLGPDGKKRLHGVASSTVKDRHGDTIALSALSEMEQSAQQNLTIFLNHSYNVPEDVAGTVEYARIKSSLQDPDIHDLALDIVVNEANDRAVKTWEAIDGGTKLGLSIGAMIPDGGAVRDGKKGTYRIDHVELLETSLVGVPANPRSWVEYAVKSLNTGETNGTMRLPSGEVQDYFVRGSDLDQQFDYSTVSAPEPEPTEEDAVIEEQDARVAAEDAARVAADEAAGVETGTPEEEAPTDVNASWELKLDRDYVDATTFGGTDTSNDISNATVSITTPYADINIDTGRSKPAAGTSQEAPVSDPENEDEDEAAAPVNPWAAIGLSDEPEVEEVETALQVLEPTVVASLRTSSELLKAITRELIDTKAALDAMTSEKDEAVAMAEKVIKGTADLLEKLAATPVGRRAVVRQANEEFVGLKATYGEEFVTLLKKG